jgi:hypothetical protein
MFRPTTKITVAATVLLLRSGLACDQGISTGNFREEVIKCEIAIAHATECCLGRFEAPEAACVHYYREERFDCGCSSTSQRSEITSTSPVFDLQASETIMATACAELAVAGECERLRAEASKPNSSSYSTGCSGDNGGARGL